MKIFGTNIDTKCDVTVTGEHEMREITLVLNEKEAKKIVEFLNFCINEKYRMAEWDHEHLIDYANFERDIIVYFEN